jgi:carbamoyltransferase
MRAAGFNPTGLPDQALDELLRRIGRTRSDVTGIAVAEAVEAAAGTTLVRLDHHFAHACTAFLPSPFSSATVVVCDDDPPHVSVWEGDGHAVTPVDWPWAGLGFAQVYSQFAETLGLTTGGHEQRMEALARIDPTRRDDRAGALISLETDRLILAADWRARIECWAAEGRDGAPVASALQSRIAELLIEFLSDVRRRVPGRDRLCVAGSLFSNSHLNSLIRLSGLFDEVFIPINPGNAGLSVGTALHISGGSRACVTPFLGPAYSGEEIKATLDNCKLTYNWASQDDRIAVAVQALQKGLLVGWFDGPMEWGPRALGARSIFANPFAPYTLENLNRFLKSREMWRGYALSGLESTVRDHFEGPGSSPFMECDYAPRDRERFRHILPGPAATVRVQTVGADAPAAFRALLQAFGDAAGIPVLVNTSFNGFREPIVCSPRDAVRVFYGTGIDILVLGEFIISK